MNLEHLSRVVFDVKNFLYPDSVIGTDSHTTMVNGLGILGWGKQLREAFEYLLAEILVQCLSKEVNWGDIGTKIVILKRGLVGHRAIFKCQHHDGLCYLNCNAF